MESSGTGSNIVGRHYDKIYKDDLVNLDCLTQMSTNQQVKNWDGASEALLNRQRKFPDDCMDLIVGTRWGPNDLWKWKARRCTPWPVERPPDRSSPTCNP